MIELSSLSALPPTHVATLDVARAMSATVVLVSHMLQVFWLPVVGLGTVLHLSNSIVSETAVIVFFMLSGYLITLSIANNIAKNGHFSLAQYVLSRTLRLYPPLLCAIAVSLAIYVLLKYSGLPGVHTKLGLPSDLYNTRETVSVNRSELVSALLMSGGLLTLNGPLWSLYIEAKLYVAAGTAGFLLAGAATRTRRLVIGAVALGAVLVFSILTQPEYLLYAAWWLFGAAFFVWRSRRGRLVELLLCLAALSTAIVLLSNRAPIVEVPRCILMSALAYCLFARWTFDIKLFSRMADSSYSLYLVHFPLLLVFYAIFCAVHPWIDAPVLLRVGASIVSLVVILAVARSIGGVAENGPLLKGAFRASLRRLGMGSVA